MGIEKKNWVSFLCTSNKALGMSGLVSWQRCVPIAISFGLETNHSFMDPFPIGIWDREKVGEIRLNNCRLAQLFQSIDGRDHLDKLDKFNVDKIKPNAGN